MTDSFVSLARRLSRDAEARRFVRFLFVGGLNTAFGYSVFAMFIFIGLHYSIAGLITTIASIIFNFFTTGKLVFESIAPYKIIFFVGVYGILYVIGLGELYIGERLGSNPYLTAAVMILPNAMLGYVLNKRWVFSPSSHPI